MVCAEVSLVTAKNYFSRKMLFCLCLKKKASAIYLEAQPLFWKQHLRVVDGFCLLLERCLWLFRKEKSWKCELLGDTFIHSVLIDQEGKSLKYLGT